MYGEDVAFSKAVALVSRKIEFDAMGRQDGSARVWSVPELAATCSIEEKLAERAVDFLISEGIVVRVEGKEGLEGPPSSESDGEKIAGVCLASAMPKPKPMMKQVGVGIFVSPLLGYMDEGEPKSQGAALEAEDSRRGARGAPARAIARCVVVQFVPYRCRNKRSPVDSSESEPRGVDLVGDRLEERSRRAPYGEIRDDRSIPLHAVDDGGQDLLECKA